MKLYFIHVPGCGACESAKPHIRRFAKAYPAIQVVPVDLTKANWVADWQPEVTPTYVLEIPGYQRVQHKGMLKFDELPKFIVKARQMVGAVR